MLLENKHGNLRVPIEVSLSDVSKIDFRTTTVPGEVVQKTSTMTLEAGHQGAGFNRMHARANFASSQL